MPDATWLRDARDVLGGLYVSPDEARMVADDAWLRTGAIDFAGGASMVWYRVLQEAAKHGDAGLRRVLERAARDYPDPVAPLLARLHGSMWPATGAAAAATTTGTLPDARPPLGDAMRDFFISYTGVDARWATWIAWTLERAGYSTWFQAWDFHAGYDFVERMHHAAAHSHRTIAVLSPAFMNSGFTQAEWSAAFASDPDGTQGLLLPVRIANFKPGGLLTARVYVDLVGKDEAAAREALLGAVGGAAARGPAGFPG